MKTEEAFNKVIDRVQYVTDQLHDYTKFKTATQKAVLIGKMHQQLMEACEVISHYKYLKALGQKIKTQDHSVE